MSELINKRDQTRDFRKQLLVTTSAIVLCAAVSTAQADDADHPTVWIELGGQLSHLDDGQGIFTPHFPNSPARPLMFSSSDGYQGLPPSSIDETGKVSFEPKGTDWVFSASIRYGRSNAGRNEHQQTYPHSTYIAYSVSGYHDTRHTRPKAAKFADTTVRDDENHLIVDFQVGKDVGLGLFGRGDSSSVLSIGVRFAQFATRTNIALKSDPDWHFVYRYGDYPSLGIYHLRFVQSQPYHTNAATLLATRSFHGIGPSLSWNGSAPILSNGKDTEVTFDLGVNAAVLFGRQKSKTHHQTTGRFSFGTKPFGQGRMITYQAPVTPDHTRSRSVIIPNVGAFAGATFRIDSVKFSAGYKADFFFGAMDNGIDAARKENVGFYGPFANISVGFGG